MKAYKETVRKYYKNWVQPTLKSDGVMGGNSFAVSASSILNSDCPAWKAFDNTSLNDLQFWHSAQGHPSWIQFYNPNPLNVSAIKITNRRVDGSMINSYGISYSDNGVNFTEFKTGTSPNQVLGGSFTVDTSGNGFHKYWRITSKSSSGSYNEYTAIDEIDITAQEMVEGDALNYNTYEDVDVYKLPKKRVTRYFKWGSPNATVKGSPTINKGVISGFSTSNYLDVSYSYKSNNATYVFKFTPTAFPATNTSAYLVHSENFLNVCISPTGMLTMYTWGNNSFPSILQTELNKTYWLKIEINGTSLRCSTSVDGVNYTYRTTGTDTKINPSNTTYPIRLGLSSATTKEPFFGSIDLTECYIEENGLKIWTGVGINTGTSTDYDFSKVVDALCAIGG